MKITSRQTYKIIYYILEHRNFTQLGVSKAIKVSFGQINKVVQWLVQKKFVEKRKKKYFLIDPSGLVTLFALERDMNNLLAKKILTNQTLNSITAKLGKKHALCLDSALENYSRYYRTNRVCVYAQSEKEIQEIENALKNQKPGFTEIWIFKQDFEPETTKIRNNETTTKLRTLIDLICDNKTFFAKDLFKQLWGVKTFEA